MASRLKNISKLSDQVVEYILTRGIDELETLSVNSVARNLNIERRKLWRIFKKEKSMTIEDYIIRIRINQAAFYLREKKELTVKKIGEKVGYYSYGYFIGIFKKYFGVTPGRYRKIICQEELQD